MREILTMKLPEKKDRKDGKEKKKKKQKIKPKLKTFETKMH